MRRLQCLLYLLLPFIAFPSYAQQGWGVGVRLGDPSGITAKYYKPRFAIEFNLGRSYSFRPYDYPGYFNKKYGYGYTYLGYRNFSAFDLQLHLLRSQSFKEEKNLSLYYGLGPQFRYRTFYYSYYYKGFAYAEPFYDYDLGLDGVIGVEYMIPDLPLTVFLDADLFLEFADVPLALWPQAGLGVRYNFFGNVNAGKGKKKSGTFKL